MKNEVGQSGPEGFGGAVGCCSSCLECGPRSMSSRLKQAFCDWVAGHRFKKHAALRMCERCGLTLTRRGEPVVL